MANKRKKDPYSPETIRAKRRFPVANTFFLTLCIIGQIILVGVAIFVQPQPQDRIDQYNVTVEPLPDGSLDITYELVWTALDEYEPLSWVEIGMANESFSIYEDSISDNIYSAEKYIEDGYCSTRVYFKNEYYGGDTLSFSFKVKQKRMLCDYDDQNLIFEFVPGWFNETPIESYTFKWLLGDGVKEHNADFEDGEYAVWSGRLGCGEYDVMKVTYSEDAFAGAKPVDFVPFDDSGAYDSLREDKIGIVVLCIFVIIVLLVVEIIICDSYVSYSRGRGFIQGYGYHMHTYGYVNPRYRTARAAHNATTGGRSGGGCACACACACAGGGRAGCSQKDTYGRKRFKISDKQE